MIKDLSNSDKFKVIEKFFSKEVIHIKSGEVILGQNEPNRRLYYVVSGKFQGYLPDEQVKDPVFEANAGSIFGVYSFFSKDHKSYTEVKATEDSSYTYYQEDTSKKGEDSSLLQSFFMDLVVTELKSRQHFAGRLTRERQASLKKLIKSEKMAVLGQMAAGLAHELNNAIGSMSSNLERLTRQLSTHFSSRQLAYFKKGNEGGRVLSTKEAREERRKFEKIKGLTKSQIKELSTMGMSPDDVASTMKRGGEQAVEDMIFSWEIGCALRDMDIAANHATHVIKSVKTLGVANQSWTDEVNVNRSIEESLAILAGLVKKVDLKLTFDESIPTIQGSPGELMQIWINLIKNAIEALEINKVNAPQVSILSRATKKHVYVEITDNGTGIPEEIQEKIFLPNFTTKIGGLSFGLGLGLTIVQRIVDEHSGRLFLESQSGTTTFKIQFPIVSPLKKKNG